MMKDGEHYKYTISGNTIMIDGNSKYTGTISGNTITLVGKKFVPATELPFQIVLCLHPHRTFQAGT